MIGSKRVKQFTGIMILSLVLIGGSSQLAEALHVSQQEFVEEFHGQDLELVLMGAGLQRFSVLKMTAVGLYMEASVKEADILADVPRRLEVAYLQNMSQSELSKQFRKGIVQNLDATVQDQVGSALTQFVDWLTDVELDDRHTFTYIPGQGTIVELNGVQKGIITDAEFAFGLFSMYIGAKPIDNRLKRKLLGSLEYYQ